MIVGVGLVVQIVVVVVVVIAKHVTQCAWRHDKVEVGHQSSRKTRLFLETLSWRHTHVLSFRPLQRRVFSR